MVVKVVLCRVFVVSELVEMVDGLDIVVIGLNFFDFWMVQKVGWFEDQYEGQDCEGCDVFVGDCEIG